MLKINLILTQVNNYSIPLTKGNFNIHLIHGQTGGSAPYGDSCPVIGYNGSVGTKSSLSYSKGVISESSQISLNSSEIVNITVGKGGNGGGCYVCTDFQGDPAYDPCMNGSNGADGSISITPIQ